MSGCVITNSKFIKEKGIEVDDVVEMEHYLNDNNGYHFRIHKDGLYIFFGDLDNYDKGMSHFINILSKFMKNRYNLEFLIEDFKYTRNNENVNSYHYSIPKWNASTEKLKEIHTNLLKEYEAEFIYKRDKKISKSVDTTIYSEHWFRCPNQKKGKKIDDTSKHVIIKGEMKDFIISYIKKDSININNNKYIEIINLVEKKDNGGINLVENKDKEIIIHTEKKEEIIDDKNSELVKYTKNNMLSTMMSQPILYKKVFDECYKQERFDMYESWMAVGMAIKNTFENDKEAFELFNYFSYFFSICFIL